MPRSIVPLATGHRAALGGVVLAAVLALGAAACGADGQSSGGVPGGGGGPFADAEALNISAGCAACHGSAGEGGVGPAYVGLAGSEVLLDDGSTVVADSDYLRRSILDPEAEVVAGFDIAMPANTLTAAEVDLLVEWIESL